MPNRLAHETSPYLLQHKDNPVDWFAWGDEAFAAARALDRPVLLSVGYSACHWCHVMEHESFEDEAIAALMNAHFINIKVDREERPDVDAIYMQAVQSFTGRGGWPMTVFLTPDALPFYGGTYYPPEARGGLPAFPKVLEAIAKAYVDQRETIVATGKQFVDQAAGYSEARPGDIVLSPDLLDSAFEAVSADFDREWGGFGRAPKFPQPMILDFLLRYYHRTKNPAALEMVETTLQRMAFGGMYDQVGGGFHRYSTDNVWLIPHFEKMLYDNAGLARVYLDAFKVTANPLYRRIARETLDYVLREMTDSSGGFYSSQDADSEGEEGRFFLWTQSELWAALGQDAELVGRYFGTSPTGNFEGRNILYIPVAPERFAEANGLTSEALETLIESAKTKLYAAREPRVHPTRDDKVLTSWNGMLLRAFAEAAFTLDEPRYRDAATRNADFLLTQLSPTSPSTGSGRGTLLHSWKDGVAKIGAYLEDYANLIDGLLATYQLTFEARYLTEAIALADEMLARFWDEDITGFYDTSPEHGALILRPRDLFDNATPAGSSVAADVLLRLAALTGNETYERRATDSLRAVAPVVQRAATAFGRVLSALDYHLSHTQELAIVWPPAEGAGTPLTVRPEVPPEPVEGPVEGRVPENVRTLLGTIRSTYLPNLLLVGAPAGSETPTPLLQDRPALDGKPTAYLCERFVCQAPTTDPAELARQIETATATPG